MEAAKAQSAARRVAVSCGGGDHCRVALAQTLDDVRLLESRVERLERPPDCAYSKPTTA
jgi:sulfite reductase beta subunit-like hemoprotein